MVAWETAETSLLNVDCFRPTRNDYKLVTLLLNQALSGEERTVAITRLCEIAAVDGCLDIRTALGTLAGLTPNDVDAFREGIETPLEKAMGYVGLVHLMGIANDAIANGDVERCTLIAAAAGYYPADALFQLYEQEGGLIAA